MPENPEKKLSGEVIESPTSNEAITRVIASLRSGIEATRAGFVDLEVVDALPPRMVGMAEKADQTPPTAAPNNVIDIRRLRHSDSALGNFLHGKRSRTLKKAA